MPDLKKLAERLRKAALEYPEAYEETPWGERVTKVKGKIFLFAGAHDAALSMSVKLPDSSKMALMFPFASPTAYGLGKSGWITARFEPGQDVPEPLLLEWIEESYRAIAPKKLVKLLDAGAAEPAPKRNTTSRATKTTKPKPKATKTSKTSKTSKAKAPKKPKKAAKPAVLLVGDDHLRLERAKAGLAEAGHEALALEPSDEVLGQAHALAPRAVVFDLGRRQPLALELAGTLAREKIRGVGIVLAGARDASAVRAAKKAVPDARAVLRVPPGDPDAVEAIAALAAEE